MSSTTKNGLATSRNTELSTYFVSFNCGRKLIDVDFFAAHLLSGHPASQNRPDVVVLSLQEIAPIAYSFLGSSLLSQYVHRFEIAVKQAFEDRYGAEAADGVVLLATENVGMTAIMVFAQQELLSRVRTIETGGTGIGLWEMGNKGAVGVRLWLDQQQSDAETVPLSLVAAHLAPMESAWQRRNEDWKSICQRLVFTPNSTSPRDRVSTDSATEPLLSRDPGVHSPVMLVSGSSLLFGGDLNYRTSDIKPHPDDHTAWPSPVQPPSTEVFAALYQQDQLNRERSAGHTLHLMDEPAIDFPPTYKYSDDAQDAAYSIAKTGEATDQIAKSLWASHRFPAWCDRILYQTGSVTSVHAYTALPIQPTSDHRPVALSALVQLRPDRASTSQKSPFQIDKNWKSKRAQAKRLEFLVGLAAYLTLTYEGNAIVAGTVIGVVGGMLALRSLLLT